MFRKTVNFRTILLVAWTDIINVVLNRTLVYRVNVEPTFLGALEEKRISGVNDGNEVVLLDEVDIKGWVKMAILYPWIGIFIILIRVVENYFLVYILIQEVS